MKKFSLRLWRIALQTIALGALLIFILTPGTFLGMAVLAIIAETAAIALEFLGLHSGACLIRAAKKRAHECARRCVKDFRRRAVATTIGAWWYLRTLYLIHRRAP